MRTVCALVRITAALVLLRLAFGECAAAEAIAVKRDFVDSTFGQIHLRQNVISDPAVDVPLVLFHPTALSSNFYQQFIPAIGSDRRVVALDTPGYGESDAPLQPESIETLAAALIMAIENLGLSANDAQIDVLGVHTGSLIAIELALQKPELVRRVLLSGIPLFEGNEREERRTQLVDRYARLPKEDASHLERFWNDTVVNRRPGLSFERAAEHAYDQYRSGQRYWWAFLAVMNYDTGSKLTQLRQPVVILNIHDNLESHNRRASELVSHSRLIDLPEVGRDAFDLHVDRLAQVIRVHLATDD